MLVEKIQLYQKQKNVQSKIHLVVNEYGIPINFIVTNGLHTNCKEAILLIENIDTKLMLEDRIYDANEILSYN